MPSVRVRIDRDKKIRKELEKRCHDFCIPFVSLQKELVILKLTRHLQRKFGFSDACATRKDIDMPLPPQHLAKQPGSVLDSSSHKFRITSAVASLRNHEHLVMKEAELAYAKAKAGK